MVDPKRLLVLGLFVVLLVTERVFSLRRRKRPWLPRFVVNMVMTACVFLVGYFVVRSAGLGGAGRAASWGLVGLLPVPAWAGIAIGFALMDLTFYYWHRANHKIWLLWRFHNVHHVDPDLDVSTSFRFHFVEIGYSTLFRVAQVMVLGVTPLTYVIYETAFTCGTMFHHSNLRLPSRLECWLNKVLVTPRMHGVHHSAVLGETDSNYSVVFSWWDRLHRTLVLNVPQAAINIGVPAYQDSGDNGLWSLIKMPFVRQRDYWRGPDGELTASNQRETARPSQMLA